MKLTKKGFINWLKNYKGTHVGRSSNPWTCPIAKYFKVIKKENITVGSDMWDYSSVDRRGKDRVLPKWAINFIREVDSRRNVRITVKKALKILEKKRVIIK